VRGFEPVGDGEVLDAGALSDHRPVRARLQLPPAAASHRPRSG
jgi:hypothetical protein